MAVNMKHHMRSTMFFVKRGSLLGIGEKRFCDVLATLKSRFLEVVENMVHLNKCNVNSIRKGVVHIWLVVVHFLQH